MRSMSETRSETLKRHWYAAALNVLALGTVAAFLVNLSANGWENSFSAATVQAGSEDWTAFLFVSLDQANSITVDKQPAALWQIDLRASDYGLSSFSILL